MFGSVSLEVAMGIIFVFLIVSIICSTIREGIEAILKTRAAYLERGIRELLKDRDGKGLAKILYDHPLISGLFPGDYTPKTIKKVGRPGMFAYGGKLPSYIPAKNFAVALMDIAARGAKTDEVSGHPDSPVISLESVRSSIANLSNSHVQRALLTAIDSAQNDLDRAQKNIEDWYNSSMDRISGWYKRSTNWILFWIGLIVAVGFNVNAITITDFLYKNDAARKVIVARAETVSKDSSFHSQGYNDAKKELEDLAVPLGWSQGLSAEKDPKNWEWWRDFWTPILGWLVIAFAATFGAPFWFDLLNKIMVIRSTVKPHEKSLEEGSEDRQPKDQKTSFVIVPPAQVAGNPASPVAASAQPVFPADVPDPRDATTSIDGCGITTDVITSDEELPPSTGGVA